MASLETAALVITTIAFCFSSVISASLWRKIGRLETSNENLKDSVNNLKKDLMAAVKATCPWGVNNCPSFRRAQDEAAPKRELENGENG